MKESNGIFSSAAARFGVPGLYPWQQFVVASVLDCFSGDPDIRSETARNRIVLLPTGAGKSLCFQVPAAELPGITLVVYPLLALMADQEKNLKKAGFVPAVFRGGMSGQEYDRQFEMLENGSKFIIANPEILQSEKILRRIQKFHIAHFVVDEAHCVAVWGDTFRPAYLGLARVIERLEPDTVTAFTATASPEILARIQKVLFDGEAAVMRGDCDRPNLYYRVRSAAARDPALLREVLAAERPAVVFCGTRYAAEHTALLLRRVLGLDAVRFYHAGLDRDEKHETERWFNESKEGILTATCAWGMGVDKRDVRTVLHYDIPASVEAYVQEAGRAGRDGSDVKAIALFTGSLPSTSPMSAFVSGTVCRRKVLLSALTPPACRTEPEEQACAGCDVCSGNVCSMKDLEIAVSFVKRNRFRYSFAHAHRVLLKKANEVSIDMFGCLLWEPEDMRIVLEKAIRDKRVRTVKLPLLCKYKILY